MQTVFPLRGVVQHYAWGGSDFLPDLLNVDNRALEPYAEWWLGAHQKGPSRVNVGGKWISLTELLTSDSEEMLGDLAISKFGKTLPFLLKILDVKKMLSIQVHPDKKAAERGFAEEETLGVPLDAYNRNFRDDNHKPELMWALTDFWLLHGFRTVEDISLMLQSVEEFVELNKVFESKKEISILYRHIMEMPQSEVNELLEPLKRRLQTEHEKGLLKKINPDFWAHRAFQEFTTESGYDRGVFSIYLLNLVYLKKGASIFQDSGILHAYLEGVNVELMANSDNVLRGGLTPKYVDVGELMKHVRFESVVPDILSPVKKDKATFIIKTPAPDFELIKIELKKDQNYQLRPNTGPQIYMVLEGVAQIGENFSFSRGEAFFVPDISELEISGEGFIFRAALPKQIER